MFSPKEIAQSVFDRDPKQMVPNVVENVFAFTQKVKKALEAEGYAVKFIGKTRGEGQFTPEGFESRWVKYKNSDYFITGVSHDALWVDGQQYDFVIAGNDSVDEISDVARPTANPIPSDYWRPNNPPVELKSTSESIGPKPPTVQKPYMGDLFWSTVGAQLATDYRDYNQALNAGSLVWIGRLSHSIYVDGMTPEAAVAKHRAEWLAILRG